MSRPNEDSSIFLPDLNVPDRHSSAPPALEIQTESVFAWTVEYAKIFSDIRAHEDYYKFYQGSYEKDKLPVPLETSLMFDYEDEDITYDKNMLQAQQDLQKLNIGRTAKREEDGIWTPQARRLGLEERFQHEQIISSWSSPTAQTAFKSAQFILSDEQSSTPQNHSLPIQDSLEKNPQSESHDFKYFSNGQANRNDFQEDHDGEENHSKSKIPCRYFASGFCSRGDKCFYSHDIDQKSNGSINFVDSLDDSSDEMMDSISQSGKLKIPNRAKASSPIKPEILFAPFEQIIGKIYQISKDQQGCRYLQKKLEEQNPVEIQAIFSEVYEHINELMIDPFGNYLCQKLLEFCNTEQRYLIVKRVAPDLVEIAKNMHGTRAVQKMVECLSSPQQIAIIKEALADSVVDLIKDLNGNHVIQRCLNRLQPEDNQFIYDAVTKGTNCIQVATHRHGCCVLQRCIDHASKTQKVQLLNDIIRNALPLVQDPYGNYVVQYALELPFPDLVHRLIAAFFPHLKILATQKFSSNVVEKCLNVSAPEVRKEMISRIIEPKTLLVLLQDPYGNYVVQTAMNLADPIQHRQMVEAIKPHVGLLRNTPYGKRIQNKIAKG